MNHKAKALKGLLALAIVIALCMFFARTVQTITTPKIHRISSTRGKLEQRIALSGSISFSETESVKIQEAKKLGITVEKVNVRPGYAVQEGDVIFTAYAPEYEAKLKELADKRNDKVKEYASEYAAHIKLRQTSDQNNMYNDMVEGIDAYYEARYALLAQAQEEGYMLPDDVLLWGEIKDGSDILNALSTALNEATAVRDAAVQMLSDLYNGKLYGVYRIGDTTFEYIRKIEGLRAEIDDLDQQMLALQALNAALTEIKAPHGGYITSFELKAGDAYDGSKPAYEMTKSEGLPVLRVDVSKVDKPLRAGLKATLSLGDAESEVEKVETDTDGKKYAYIKLDSKTLKEAGGLSAMMNAGNIDLRINYKAQKSTTLLPASAVRSDGNGGWYVFTVDRTYGGLLDSSGYKATKMSVTVLEKSDQVISLSEDLSYREIADREDRPISDGQAVMDYVD